MPEVKIKSIKSICKHLTKLRIKIKVLEGRNSEFDLLKKKFQDLENKLNEIGLKYLDKDNSSLNSENDSSNSTTFAEIKIEPAEEGQGKGQVNFDQFVTENKDSLIALNSGIDNEADFGENLPLLVEKANSTKIQEKLDSNRTAIVSMVRISNSEIQNYLKKSQNSSGQKIEKKKNKCKICGKILTAKYMTIHMRIHSGKKPYKCQICPRNFYESGQLVIHIRAHTGEKPYKCSKCQKPFARGDYLKSHMLVHSDKRIFSCKVCQKRFKSRNYWRIHSKKHTGQRDNGQKSLDFPHLQGKQAGNGHKDEINNLDFDQKLENRNLQIKPIIGNQSESKIKKKYKCEICEKSFVLKYKLTKHLVSHSDLRPFECLICKKTFKRKDVLLAHSRLHSRNQDDLFKCPKCPSAYNHRYVLKNHISEKHNDNPEIQISDSIYKLEAEKKRRMKNELHTCQICLAVFSNPSKLDEHLATSHSN